MCISSGSFSIFFNYFTAISGSYPGFKIDIEKELDYYKSIRDEILEMTIDTIEYSNAALKDGKSILIEGANATSTYLPLFFFIIDNSTYLLSFSVSNS